MRLRTKIKSPRVRLQASPNLRDKVLELEKRRVWFDGKPVLTTIYERERMRSGRLRGPAVVAEYSATTIVPPGTLFYLDGIGNLIMGLGKKKGRPGSSAPFRT